MMSALSDTLSTLVRQLSLCELELSKLDSHLQSEFAQRDAKAPNPYMLLIKLRKLQRQLPGVRQDCQLWLQEKQAAVEELERQMQLAAGQLSTLQQRTGAAIAETC